MKKLLLLCVYASGLFAIDKGTSDLVVDQVSSSSSLAATLRQELGKIRESLQKATLGLDLAELKDSYLLVRDLALKEKVISDMMDYISQHTDAINSVGSVKIGTNGPINSDSYNYTAYTLSELVQEVEKGLDSFSGSDLTTDNMTKIKEFLTKVEQPLNNAIAHASELVDKGKLDIEEFVASKEGFELGELDFEENLIEPAPELQKLIELNEQGQNTLGSSSLDTDLSELKELKESFNRIEAPDDKVSDLEQDFSELQTIMNSLPEDLNDASSSVDSKLKTLQEKVESIKSSIKAYKDYYSELETFGSKFRDIVSKLSSYQQQLERFRDFDFASIQLEFNSLVKVKEELDQAISADPDNQNLKTRKRQLDQQVQEYSSAIDVYESIEKNVSEQLSELEQYKIILEQYKIILDINVQMIKSLSGDLENLSSFEDILNEYQRNTSEGLSKIKDYASKFEDLKNHLEVLKDIKEKSSNWSKLKDWFKSKYENLTSKNPWRENGSLRNKIEDLNRFVEGVEKSEAPDIASIETERARLTKLLENAQGEALKHGVDLPPVDGGYDGEPFDGRGLDYGEVSVGGDL